VKVSVQILCTIPYDVQPSDCIKWFANFRPLDNHPNKLLYGVTFAQVFVQYVDGCLQKIRVAYLLW